ncbi:MAG: hypothetical protein CL938_03305 [Deltaproteobacteria bacterium]|jgi:hypothetical protein|nr:hypothetical protein [Deltaproteobacteria bacterium]
MAEPPEVAAAIDIINMAFQKMGMKAIANIDVDNKAARLAKSTYASIRNDVLRSHPWNFATEYRQLSAGTLPAGAWDYDTAFDLPAMGEYLAVHAVQGQTSQVGDEWAIVGDQILTNLANGTADAPTLNVLFIKRVIDVLKYDASFIEHLCERLQAEWVEPLRGVTNLAEAKMAVSDEKGRRAMSADGMEGTPRKLESSTFVDTR